MAFRNIIVESPAHISVKNKQLIIKTDGEHSLAVEDISALLLESRQSTITTAALSLLGQCGCAVFVCDEKHVPCAVLTPYSQHSRQLAVAESQLSLGEVLKKHLWQSIVVAKINNQAECLRLCGNDKAAEGLDAIAASVRSGDSGNAEAQAAARYFPALFQKGFTRSADNGINSALNYGYAILRGCMVRYLASYGFLPMLGLHHKSELNSFNLADDMMEPFRPVVDLMTYTLFNSDDELTPDKKRLLFNCLNLDITSGGQKHSVAYAMERAVQSLQRSMNRGENALVLPGLLPLNQHRYE